MEQYYSPLTRIIGSLFFYPPNEPQNKPLIALFQTGAWQADCHFLSENKRSEIQQNLQKVADEQIEADYQALFIGPNNLPAPPWGSVYLDKESVVFGESLLALRAFLQHSGIDFSLNQNEPEDHIGLMLMLTAYLLDENQHLLKPFWQSIFCLGHIAFLSYLMLHQPRFIKAWAFLLKRYCLICKKI